MATERPVNPIAQTAALFAGGLAAGVGSVLLAQKALGSGQHEYSPPVPPLGPVEFVERAPPRSLGPARSFPSSNQAASKGAAQKLTTPAASSHSKSITDLDAATVVGVTGVEQPHPAPETPKKHTATHATLLAEKSDAAGSADVHAPLWLSRPLHGNTAVGSIERQAFNASDAVFVYDSDATAFGRWVEASAKVGLKGEQDRLPSVHSLTTRAGAATAVLGYLSGASTSASPIPDGLTASILTDARGLVAMAPALAFTPSTGRIVAQISSAGRNVSGTGDGQVDLADDAHATFLATSILGEGDAEWTAIYTSNQNEIVDVTAASYKASKGNVAHIFDGVFAGREVDSALVPSPSISNAEGATVLDVLSAAKWDSFVYTGPSNPEVVLIVPNSSVAATAKFAHASLDARTKTRTAVLAVRILRPWDETALLAAIPASTQRVVVLDLDEGVLGDDVEIALLGIGTPVSKLRASADAGPAQISAALQLSLTGPTTWAKVEEAAREVQLARAAVAGKLLTLLDTESSSSTYAGQLIARFFADAAANGVVAAKALSPRALQRFDNFHGPQAAGVVRSDVVFGPRKLSVAAGAHDGQAQTVVLAQPSSLASALDTLALVAEEGTVLLDTSGWDAPATDVITERLPPLVQRTIAARSLKLVAIDASEVIGQLEATAAQGDGKGKQVSFDKEIASVVLAIAALQVHLNAAVTTLSALVKPTLTEVPGLDVSTLISTVSAALSPVSYDTKTFASAKEEEGKSVPVLPGWKYTNYNRLEDRSGAAVEPAAQESSWASLAWQRLYPEAYELKDDSLRADLAPERLWEVEVTENRRLTPLDYDRNVFHLEMSTKGTDLTYEVGEALGVHGWNDEDEVRDFIRWTGFQPDQVISVPLPNDKAESFTVFQLLLQRKDIFGRPGKSFYGVLADKAADVNEAKWLRFIASAEGNSTFKKYAEVETVTYADVIRMFPSVLVNFTVNDLLQHIEDIQPRHYSIASAQAAVGESVHLLIVTVDWKTPSGSPRYGQCTRYLSKLRPGDKVTVSVRPSVMKLPPLSEQPIIMAGLGTGAAPFRAFLQARAVQKAQGLPIGPMVYYFGSRYRGKEYLYGEELEAFRSDGLLTRLGLAFSRDQKHKVYIQDKISQDAEIMTSYLAPELASAGGEVKPASLADALVSAQDKDKGFFYLCGPYVTLLSLFFFLVLKWLTCMIFELFLRLELGPYPTSPRQSLTVLNDLKVSRGPMQKSTLSISRRKSAGCLKSINCC